jgi:hypothetical protein
MTTEETVTLWRPTGPQELALVELSGWRMPRLIAVLRRTHADGAHCLDDQSRSRSEGMSNLPRGLGGRSRDAGTEAFRRRRPDRSGIAELERASWLPRRPR